MLVCLDSLIHVYRDSKASILETISRLGMENFSLHDAYGKTLQICLTQLARSAEKKQKIFPILALC
jgi:hypothetical protein